MTVELEALISYLALRQLDRLLEYGRKQADTLGLTEDDAHSRRWRTSKCSGSTGTMR